MEGNSEEKLRLVGGAAIRGGPNLVDRESAMRPLLLVLEREVSRIVNIEVR